MLFNVINYRITCYFRIFIVRALNIYIFLISYTLRKKCPYLELFWSTFSRIRTEYREILRISPCLVQMRENADQNNYEYGHFLSSEKLKSMINYLSKNIFCTHSVLFYYRILKKVQIYMK